MLQSVDFDDPNENFVSPTKSAGIEPSADYSTDHEWQDDETVLSDKRDSIEPTVVQSVEFDVVIASPSKPQDKIIMTKGFDDDDAEMNLDSKSESPENIDSEDSFEPEDHSDSGDTASPEQQKLKRKPDRKDIIPKADDWRPEAKDELKRLTPVETLADGKRRSVRIFLASSAQAKDPDLSKNSAAQPSALGHLFADKISLSRVSLGASKEIAAEDPVIPLASSVGPRPRFQKQDVVPDDAVEPPAPRRSTQTNTLARKKSVARLEEDNFLRTIQEEPASSTTQSTTPPSSHQNQSSRANRPAKGLTLQVRESRPQPVAPPSRARHRSPTPEPAYPKRTAKKAQASLPILNRGRPVNVEDSKRRKRAASVPHDNVPAKKAAKRRRVEDASGDGPTPGQEAALYLAERPSTRSTRPSGQKSTQQPTLPSSSLRAKFQRKR